MKMDKKLAGMILKAMEYRESSYDKAAADEATTAAEAAAGNDSTVGYICDYSTFYGLSLEQAAEKAATEAGEPTMASIIFYLMYHAWNDVQSWVKEHDLASEEPAGPERHDLAACIWKRESTQEWVLELSGTLNDTSFTCRHTEPVTTPLEDVPGLPTRTRSDRTAEPDEEGTKQLHLEVTGDDLDALDRVMSVRSHHDD
jgi:hypothetical protein